MQYRVNEGDIGKRLDVLVVELIPSVSRSMLQKLIKDKQITVNGAVLKNSYKLRLKDKVSVNYDEIAPKVNDTISMPIIFENDDCVVLDKPAGVLTHSKGVFNQEGTVASFIESKTNGMEGNRAGIVHRLDRGTSGVILCAKTPEAMKWLQGQFSKRNVKKKYIAVVSGRPNPDHAIIDMPIERNPKAPQTFRVGSNGKPSVTEYEVIKSNDHKSLIELSPTTGRTHQIRVHMKQLKCPIIGDKLYGGEEADRMYLHAEELEITLPNSERKIFISKLPSNFNELVK